MDKYPARTPSLVKTFKDASCYARVETKAACDTAAVVAVEGGAGPRHFPSVRPLKVRERNKHETATVLCI